MKSGKIKIISSVICLVAALSFAIFAVYAWFVTNTNVDANGIQGVTTSGDITKFEITCYKAETSDGITYKKGETIEPDASMANYSPRPAGDNASDTAVILKIYIGFNKNHSSDLYMLSAQLNHTDPYPEDFEAFSGANYLSNAVTFKSIITQNGSDFELDKSDSKIYTFVEDVVIGEENTVVSLKKNDIAEIQYSTNELTKYLVMDYEPTYINALYSIMIQQYPNDATLSTPIDFISDIYFRLG